MAYYKALNGESHNGIFLFCFLVLDFSFFQIILDGDGATKATSRNRKWKTSSQVSFFLSGNEVANMGARL